MFLSGTGVLAEELPARGLAPVNKTTHPFFFQYLEDLTYDLYVNYRPKRFFPTDFCELHRLTIRKDGSIYANAVQTDPSRGMIISVVKPFYPQMNYDEMKVEISLCKTKYNDIQFMYFTKDNREGGDINGLVVIDIEKDYRQLNKKPKEKDFIYTSTLDPDKNVAGIYGRLKNASSVVFPFK